MKARLALLAATLITLAGCGLHPLYSGGASGPVATQLAQVTVASIPGKNGWLVHNNLVDRLRATGSAAPRYRLDVKLDDDHRFRSQAQQPDHTRAAVPARALSAHRYDDQWRGARRHG